MTIQSDPRNAVASSRKGRKIGVVNELSVFLKVKPGREKQIREVFTGADRPAKATKLPYSVGTVHEAGIVSFDNDTRLLKDRRHRGACRQLVGGDRPAHHLQHVPALLPPVCGPVNRGARRDRDPGGGAVLRLGPRPRAGPRAGLPGPGDPGSGHHAVSVRRGDASEGGFSRAGRRVPPSVPSRRPTSTTWSSSATTASSRPS
jgi:hypothetical protein